MRAQPGTFAANCLLARRLAERDVRFIQLYHPGWDHHGGLPAGIRQLCRETDQGCAALITDLKQRGMLDETLVVWGGEFGRTNYSQGKLTATDYGRDHHPRCFTAWAAGGGIKPGITYGATDPFGYSVATDGVHVHDFHATILHLLGVDHERLTYKHQGRYYRLTDVSGKVVRGYWPDGLGEDWATKYPWRLLPLAGAHPYLPPKGRDWLRRKFEESHLDEPILEAQPGDEIVCIAESRPAPRRGISWETSRLSASANDRASRLLSRRAFRGSLGGLEGPHRRRRRQSLQRDSNLLRDDRRRRD